MGIAWLAIKTWLSSTFGAFKVWLAGTAIVLSLVGSVAIYLKGRADCNAAHLAASAKYLHEFNEQQTDDIFEIAKQSANSTEEYQKIEAHNDEVETHLLQPLTPNDGCIDAVWLRGLSKLY